MNKELSANERNLLVDIRDKCDAISGEMQIRLQRPWDRYHKTDDEMILWVDGWLDEMKKKIKTFDLYYHSSRGGCVLKQD
jgi:hypothetical protein